MKKNISKNKNKKILTEKEKEFKVYIDLCKACKKNREINRALAKRLGIVTLDDFMEV